MRPLFTTEQARALDERTIEEATVPGLILMENAGLKTAHIIAEHAESVEGAEVTILCGKGNNGGDGFVIGRHLVNMGATVYAYLFAKASEVRGDAKVNLQAFVGTGGELIEEAGKGARIEQLYAALEQSDLVIDALLGTGLSSDVEGPMAAAIEAVNECPAFVVAVDIPSGINADTGRAMGVAVQADLTCTYGAMKIGQWQYPGRAHCGELVEVEISIPVRFIAEANPGQYLLGDEDIWPGALVREPDSHKGHYGHLLVIAGSHGKSGAAVLACRGALRAGAGLVTLAVPAGLEPVVAPQSPETMTALLEENDAGGIAEGVAAHLGDLLNERSAALLGPGIPTDAETDRALEKFLKKAKQPLVIDADGLNLLARLKLAPSELASESVIVTPHPGEMARLTGLSTDEIQANRVEAARSYATEQQVICVLKGASTVIADPEGLVYIVPFGNPGLASGGTGDVLAGMIAGLLVQEGIIPVEAAATAAILHGLAADRLVVTRGSELALAAGDIPEELPGLLHDLTHPDDEHEHSH